ncbi:hypothetical protein TgHK011_000199 [Trichoderma gracile]|nr:hypothetical protein TgHK011_000199 [Trichoderma gracile]
MLYFFLIFSAFSSQQSVCTCYIQPSVYFFWHHSLASRPLASPASRLSLSDQSFTPQSPPSNPAACYSSPQPANGRRNLESVSCAAHGQLRSIPASLRLDCTGPHHCTCHGRSLAVPMRKRDIRPASFVSNTASSGKPSSALSTTRALPRTPLNAY